MTVIDATAAASVGADDGALPRAPLHFATVGSVDDGKSTLIGRLLHDSKSIFEDQLEHIEAVSRRRGNDYVDLALLTDGLRAEREQGITIDVAYRYFSTPRRSFVIADCPGHTQYTRNMITGVSRADLAIILVDARHGIVEQTRRHTLLTSLLRVPHLVVAVNKMDLVDHQQRRFDEIRDDFEGHLAALDAHLDAVTFIPMSRARRGQRRRALCADELVLRADVARPPRDGGCHDDDRDVPARFPVQYVIRPQRAEHRDYRGYAGTSAAGTLRTGDDGRRAARWYAVHGGGDRHRRRPGRGGDSRSRRHRRARRRRRRVARRRDRCRRPTCRCRATS